MRDRGRKMKDKFVVTEGRT